MRHALALLSLAGLLAGCRADPGHAKQPALDFSSLAGPGPEAFSREADLLARWPGALSDAFAAGRDGELEGVEGLRLRYHVLGTPGGPTVLYLGGRTEYAEELAEVMADLVAQGYTVYTLDHRGQGGSGRMLDDPQKGYVEVWGDYAADVDRFVESVMVPEGASKILLLAHSMGGAIAIDYADAHPERVRAMALSAPMLEIDTGGFAPPIAATLGLTDCSISAGTSYVPGGGPYEPEASVEESTTTHSEARWQWRQQLAEELPQRTLGSTTFRWFCEAMRGASRLEGLGRYSNIPTVIFQAGEDSIVKPGGQDRYCADAARCQIQRFEASGHEVFHETDAIRNEALSIATKLFLASAP